MYELQARRLATLTAVYLASTLTVACGSDQPELKNHSTAGGFGGFGARQVAGFGGGQLGSGGVQLGAGGIVVGGAASGAGFMGGGGFMANGGAPATGGMLQLGTGGVVDPGPRPTGQILDCRGTGPCLIDDGDACCIGASTDSHGTVVSISENCIPPNASCNYPLSIAYCDGPEDCRPSEVCCGILKPYGNVPLFGELSCQPAGMCGDSQRLVVCRQGVNACPGTTTCGSYPTLPADISVCR